MTGIETEATCPRCGAPVRWRLSAEGTRLRLDAEPDPGGTVILVELGGKMRAKVLCGPELPAQQEAWRMHRCPTSGRPGPACAVCGFAMEPRELFEMLRWTTHPGIGCDAQYQAEMAKVQAGIRRKAS